MSPKRALSLLGYLASEPLQVRYIVAGTKDRYVLVDELLEDASRFLRDPLVPDAPSVAAFKDALSELMIGDGESNRALIEKNDSWAKLRRSARAVLAEIGADLRGFESEELTRAK